MLLRPEYKNQLDLKYKKKIEAIVRWVEIGCQFTDDCIDIVISNYLLILKSIINGDFFQYFFSILYMNYLLIICMFSIQVWNSYSTKYINVLIKILYLLLIDIFVCYLLFINNILMSVSFGHFSKLNHNRYNNHWRSHVSVYTIYIYYKH